MWWKARESAVKGLELTANPCASPCGETEGPELKKNCKSPLEAWRQMSKGNNNEGWSSSEAEASLPFPSDSIQAASLLASATHTQGGSPLCRKSITQTLPEPHVPNQSTGCFLFKVTPQLAMAMSQDS